jgi:hypothetical protein
MDEIADFLSALDPEAALKPFGLRVAPGCSGAGLTPALASLPPAFATWQGCRASLHPVDH